MDGQILGRCQSLMEEEEVGRAEAAPSARPAFPEMGSHELRLASFCDWPLTALVRPELLAAAGFFHTGESCGPGRQAGPFWTEGAQPPQRRGSRPDEDGGRGPTAPHTCPQPWSLFWARAPDCDECTWGGARTHKIVGPWHGGQWWDSCNWEEKRLWVP